MRKYCSLCLTVLLLACVASPAGAATYTYSDSTGTLQDLPSAWGFPSRNYFFPDSGGGNPVASGAIVTIDYTTVADPDLAFGGASNSGDSTNNQLTIKNTQTGIGVVYGSISTSGNSTDNTVSFKGGTITQGFIGGSAGTNGTAENNKITIEGGTVTSGATVYGGYSYQGATKGNKVYMNSGTTIGVDLYGGYGVHAENNLVQVTSGKHKTSYGGYSTGLNGIVYKNTATLKNAESTDYIYGGYAENGGGLVSENTVNIESGAKALNVRGGHAENSAAEKNRVYIRGGIISAPTVGGFTDGNNRSAENNVVVMGGTANNLYGGASNGGGTVEKNIVTLAGGTVTGMVVGGQSTGISRDNVVLITKATDLQAATLWGSYRSNNASGNTLEVYVPATVKGLNRFEKYKFFLAGTTQKGDTIITVTNGSGGASPSPISIAGASVEVGLKGPSSELQKGDTINLIKETGGLGITGTPAKTKGVGIQGYGLLYDFDIEVQNGDTLVAIVAKPGADGGDTGGDTSGGDGSTGGGDSGTGGGSGAYLNPRTKSLLEGQIASAAFIGQGSELIAGQGMSSALNAARPLTGTSGPAAFAAMSGGTSRYHSGSHVDVHGMSLMTGLGKNFALNNGSAGNLLAGAFFEAGFGGYDSYNSFRTQPSTKGDGTTNYYGGGVLTRYDAPVGLYVEASARAGKVKNEFKSKDWVNSVGKRAHYDSASTYYGAHGGLGFVYQISKPVTLDVYSKYMWTRQEGDTISMGGEKFRFKDVDSHRSRTGARVAYDLAPESTAKIAVYAGGAFDYEFNGKSRGTTHGRSITSPSIKGGTGMGELGVTVKPSATSGFSADLGFQGYTGKREGVSGSVQLKFEF